MTDILSSCAYAPRLADCMVKLFISYRRADSQEITDRLHDQMSVYFGEDNVFQDVIDIPPGVDFRQYVRRAIAACDAVLVMIGPDWGRILQQRADDPADLVRIEVEAALAQGKLVVPVTVRGAAMPRPEELPDSLRELCWRNRAVVRPNPDFKHDCKRLAEGILAAVGRAVPSPRRPAPADAEDARATREIARRQLPQALQRARVFAQDGRSNADWQPFVTTFDDLPLPEMAFCLVPAGRFRMGSADYDDEKPAHPQTFDQPFYIAQTPVTNAQWRAAVEAGAVSAPQVEKALTWYKDPAMADAPVAGITWAMAQAFTQWLGVCLPTEREWEYAARGPDALDYPWGGAFDAARAVYRQTSLGRPWSVTSHPQGASWVGALHMAGNVWEWTASLHETYPYLADGSRERDGDAPRVLRGGSWVSDAADLRAAFRVRSVPHDWFVNVDGLRCARGVL